MAEIKNIRRLLNIIFAILLIISLSFNFLIYNQNKKLSAKLDSFMCVANQLDSTNAISFISSININDYKDVEIFDIGASTVVKKIPSNEIIQNEVVNILENITGVYVKIKPMPRDGYIIKVPLEPSVRTKNHWLTDQGIMSVNEVFIFLLSQEKPFILVMYNNMPYFYTFEGNTEVIMKEINR